VWLEQKYSNILNQLNIAGRNNNYTSSFCTTQTGKTVDQLWADYAANPVLTTPTPTEVSQEELRTAIPNKNAAPAKPVC
jgi:hypothetical protein